MSVRTECGKSGLGKVDCCCHGCSCTGNVAEGKDKLKERFDLFQSGRWEQLLGSSVAFDEEASIQSTKKWRTQNHGDLEHRVNRALSCVQTGELTAGRQALEGADGTQGQQKLCSCCVRDQRDDGTHFPMNWSIMCPRLVMDEDKFG